MSGRDRTRRLSGTLLFLAAVGYGLTLGIGQDGRWLALLALGGLGLLLAAWPRLPRDVPRLQRGTLQTATILVTLFVLLATQLLRLQVVQGGAIAGRVAVAPNGEVVANPRRQSDDLRGERGRILASDGTILARSVADGDVWRRVYPDLAAADVVGYFAPLQYGTAGLEATYEDQLAGRTGNPISRLLNGLLHRSPRGNDLILTLDAGLQTQAHTLLNGRPGAVVLLDAQTGAVLAMASEPTIDPNQLFAISPAERDAAATYWAALVADPARPLVTRATLGLFTPGSIFKTITAAAAIATGISSPDTVYTDNGALDVGGHTLIEENRPDPSVDRWTLADGIAYSLNVVLARVGLALGADRLADYAGRFGFGTAPPFDLPVAASQLTATPDFLGTPTALADTAFGQGQIQVTPLEMALVAASFANGGAMMRPYLVDRVVTADGNTVHQTKPAVWRQPVPAATAEQVRQMMIGAVERGYVQGARIAGLTVGGKTGTAETGTGAPHAWFIGFVGPPGQPARYAVAVVLEHGGAGLAGSTAIGRAMLAAAMGQPGSG